MKTVIDTQRLLKYSYGATVLLVGLDKLFRFNLIANWEQYIAPEVATLLPISVGTFLALIAVVEIVVGIAILTKWTYLFAYVAAAWLLLISVDLLLIGYIDIAARDILLAVGAVSLAWLTQETERVGRVSSN